MSFVFPNFDFKEIPPAQEILSGLVREGLVLFRNVPIDGNRAFLDLATSLGQLMRPPGILYSYDVEDEFVYLVTPACTGGEGPISQTDSEFEFHTDGFCLRELPEIVLMLALIPSKEGGITSFVDVETVLPFLHQADVQSLTQKEYTFVSSGCRPILTRGETGMMVAFNPYDLAGIKMNERSKTYSKEIEIALRGDQAVHSFYSAVKKSPSRIDFRYNIGDCLVVNNRKMLHSRTSFNGTRLLKRIWLKRD